MSEQLNNFLNLFITMFEFKILLNINYKHYVVRAILIYNLSMDLYANVNF